MFLFRQNKENEKEISPVIFLKAGSYWKNCMNCKNVYIKCPSKVLFYG